MAAELNMTVRVCSKAVAYEQSESKCDQQSRIVRQKETNVPNSIQIESTLEYLKSKFVINHCKTA